MRFRIPVLCAAMALAVSACTTETKRDLSSDFAATPEQAAVGYDKMSRESVQKSSDKHSGIVEAKFVCPDASIAYGTVAPDDTSGPSRYSARATKVGTHWKVTVEVAFDDYSGTMSAYEVQRREGGYCVSDQLPVSASEAR